MPFTTEEFLNVFRSYNESVFPAQLFLIFAAVIILFLLIKNYKSGGRMISLLLAILWIWTGVVYHLIFFTKINNAAYIFGPLFILQGLILFFYGTVYNLFSFRIRNNSFNAVGFILILYSLIIYPLIGYLSGHGYPYSPTFGLPCPTTIFTIGILLFIENKLPFAVIIIPFLWSLLGFSAALNFTIYEDLGLPAAGVTGIIFYFLQRSKTKLQVKAA